MDYKNLVSILLSNPEVNRWLFTLLLFALMSLFLVRSIDRYRADQRRRLDECEDAHIESGSIMLDWIQLTAEQAGLMKMNDRKIDTIDFKIRQRKIVERTQKHQMDLIERRKQDREKMDKKLRFKLPTKITVHTGD